MQIAQIGNVTLPNLEARLDGIGQSVQAANDKVNQADQTVVGIVTQVSSMPSNLDAFKQQTADSLLKAESTLTSSIGGLVTRIGHAETKIMQVESIASKAVGSAPGQTSTSGTNFVPWKHMTPAKFGSKTETWREWQEDIRGYFDGTKPGLKDVLQELENAEEEKGHQYVEQNHPLFANEGPALWRALKALTEQGSDARMIVASAPEEDGFLAWAKLSKTYGMQLAQK